MRKNDRCLGQLARKAGACLLSGVLAAALVPAAAFAYGGASSSTTDTTTEEETYSLSAYDQGKQVDLGIADETFEYDSDGDGVADSSAIIWADGEWTTYDTDNGIYVWSTYVKGDNSHYGHYDAQFTFTVDDDGVLQSVDLSSQGTTFGGVWGNISKSTTITGYLPTGVTNDTTVTTNSDGSATVTLALSGTEGIGGYSVSSATLYQVAADGGLYELDENGDIVYEEVYDESDGDTDLEAVSLGSEDVSDAAETGTVEVADVSTDTGYGLLEVTYTIGSYYKFTQYTVLNEYGDLYEITDTDFWAEPDGIGQKNRDSYTGISYNIIMQRELASFLSDDEDVAAEVDIVSGATKSTDAVVEALYAAFGYYYPITNQGDYVTVEAEEAEWDAIFSSVATGLEITMDANPGESYTPENGTIDAQDTTSVTKDADGNYVLTSGLLTSSEIISLSSVALYDYGEATVAGQQLVDLGLETGYVLNGSDGYEGSDEYVGGMATSNTVNHGFLGNLGESDEDATITDDDGNTLATWDYDTKTLTIESDEVTHVAIGYGLAKQTSDSKKGITGVAYSLEELYEATQLSASLEDAAASMDATTIASAQAALEGTTLSTAAKTFVSASSISMLENAAAVVEGQAAFAATGYDQSKQADFGIADETFEYDSDGDGTVDSSEIIWEDGEWTSFDVTNGTGTAVWSTYVKGDNSHYGHYDAQFTFTVEDGVLTGVDLSSQGTTFGGVWGNISKSTTITGYLPTGVTNTTSIEVTGDGVVVSPSLAGTESIGGYSVSSATLYQVAADGGLYELDEDGDIVYEEVYDESDGDTDTVAVSLGSEDVTDEASAGAVTIEDVTNDTGYGVLEVTYTIGSYYKFTQYTVLNSNGANYSITDTDFYAEPEGIGEKNRDQYTALAYQIIIEQELASFVEDLNSESGVEGAAEVDIVSGATKSSDAIVEAVYAALGYDYPITNKGDYVTVEPTANDTGAIFTSVSDDLEITMDGNPGSNYTPANGVTDASDGTTVTVDADGNYVVTVGLSDNTDIVALSSVALYGYSGELTAAQSVELGIYSAAIINGETDYEGAEEYLAGTITSNTANHGFAGELDSCDITDADGTVLATYDSETRSLTVLSSEVTHVAFGYAQAKKTESVSSVRLGILGFAYDLASLYEEGLAADDDTQADTGNSTTVKQAQNITVKAKKATTVKYKKLKKKAQSVKAGKLYKVTGAKGKLSYSKVSVKKNGKKASKKVAKKVVVNKKTGKVTLKKGLAKGTYKVKVKVKAKATSKYKASKAKTVTVTIKVK